MKKEKVMMLAQILTAMKDSIAELDEAQKNEDKDKIMVLKKEILNYQKKIDEML